MDNLKKKGLQALCWDLFGKILTQGAGLFITIVLARLLSPEDFGLIAICMVVVGLTDVFLDSGLGSGLIQKRRVLPIHYSSVFYFNLFVGFLLTIIVYASAESIAEYYDNAQLTMIIKVTSCLFILNSIGNVHSVFLRKKLNFALLTKINFTATLVSGLIGILAAIGGLNVWSLVIQLISRSIINNLGLWLLSSWNPRLAFSFKALRKLWVFGFRYFLAGLLNAVFDRLDYIIIGKLFPLTTLGYFQRAKSFNLLLVSVTSGSIVSVIFPLLVKLTGDINRFRAYVIQSLNILAFITFLFVGILFISSEMMVTLIFSSKWLQSVPYLELLLLSSFYLPLGSLLSCVLSSRGNSKIYLRMDLIKKGFHLVNFALALRLGIDTYLLGLIVVACINILITVYFASKEINVRFIIFLKPILTQGVIFISVLYFALNFYDGLDLTSLFDLLVINSLFVLVFIMLNIVFKTGSIVSIKKQLNPFVNHALIKYKNICKL
jgi:teichuronic acid exporter